MVIVYNTSNLINIFCVLGEGESALNGRKVMCISKC